MDFGDGGKIDTVLYSAACGALSSTADAGPDAVTVSNPEKLPTTKNVEANDLAAP
jgi:hypothetical protein